jgi:hypothetical protein
MAFGPMVSLVELRTVNGFDATWLWPLATIALLAAAWLTRETDWGGQPLVITAQGLQIGTLFKDLRATDLRSHWVEGKKAELRGRFLTLQIIAPDAQVAALGERLARIGAVGGKKPQQKFALLLLPLALGACLVLPPATLTALLKPANYFLLLFLVGRLVYDGITWLRFKRGTYRF